MTNTKIYRRNLPHIHPDQGIFFITFRLYRTIPKSVLQRLQKDRKRKLKEITSTSESVYLLNKYKIEKRFSIEYGNWLDKSNTEKTWLYTPEIADILCKKIHEMDHRFYFLIAYCIMPNHVHLLIQLRDGGQINHKGKTKTYPLADVLRLLKGSSARKCNLLLNRKDPFWHHESYDHVVRNEYEFYRIIEYILNNPVKAGLVKNSKEWDYSYYDSKFIL